MGVSVEAPVATPIKVRERVTGPYKSVTKFFAGHVQAEEITNPHTPEHVYHRTVSGQGVTVARYPRELNVVGKEVLEDGPMTTRRLWVVGHHGKDAFEGEDRPDSALCIRGQQGDETEITYTRVRPVITVTVYERDAVE